MTSNEEEASAGERETLTKGAFADLLRLLRPLRMSHFLPLNGVAYPHGTNWMDYRYIITPSGPQQQLA